MDFCCFVLERGIAQETVAARGGKEGHAEMLLSSLARMYE